jgi:CBS domain-containing protein
VPAFPLDGGRLFRAALWRWTGSLARATSIATRTGIGFAYALMVLGGVQVLTGGVVGGIWLAVIGFGLRAAAQASQQNLALRETLSPLAVREVMATDVVGVPPAATIDDVVDVLWRHHVSSLPVLEGRILRGIVTLQHVVQVPDERRASVRVAGVMRAVKPALTIGPDESVDLALERASGNGLGRLAVVEGSILVGWLSVKDITHVLAPGGAGARRAAAPPAQRAA